MKLKTIVIVIITVISSIGQVYSQAPKLKWDADFGGTENEQLSCSQQTKDGGYILGGFSESDIGGDKTQLSRGTSDYWIVKIDGDGKKQWDLRFGGTSVDMLTALQQTTDGGYILGGISFSDANGDKSQPSQGNSDYWIVKINANGIKQWDARFGGIGPDELQSLQQTSDGGYILGGSSFSGISGDKTQATRGGKDFWIVKTDANGKKQWDARFGGERFEELFSIRQTKNGGYIMGGYSLSSPSGDKTAPDRGRFDFWVVKTNAHGKKQWDASFGGTDDDWLTQIRQTNDDGFILGGWSWSGKSGNKSQENKGANDYWIVKINPNGGKQWDADFGGSSNDYLNPIEQTADGGYILGGYSSSPADGDKTKNTEGGTDYWILKTNDKGKKQWDANFGGTDFDFLYALQQTKDGGYFLAGYSSSGIGGDKTEDTKGVNDYWVLKTVPGEIVCNTPGNLKTVDISVKSAVLKWDPAAGAIKYNINYRVAGRGEWTSILTPNNQIELSGLLPDTKYEWRVRSVCSVERAISSAWSVIRSFTTLKSKIATFPKEEDFSMEVFPNPLTQTANISFRLTESSPVMIELSDLNGKTVRVIANKNFGPGLHEIKLDRETLAGGMYFLRVKTTWQTTTRKIIIK